MSYIMPNEDFSSAINDPSPPDEMVGSAPTVGNDQASPSEILIPENFNTGSSNSTTNRQTAMILDDSKKL